MKYFKIDVFTRNDSEDHLKKKNTGTQTKLVEIFAGFSVL